MSIQSSNNNIKKISIGLLTLAVIALSLTSLSNLVFPQKTKFADASGPNTSNLIIGTTQTANALELSVCVQATPGPLHLANVSTWFRYNTLALTPTANTFVQKGQYGNSNNGYGALKWQQVAGTQNGSSDTFTMSLVYSGDGVTPGLAGLPMATTPELFGRVSFAKIPMSTASTSLDLVKNVFYSTESPSTAINQTVSYVNGDCVTSTNVVINSSSSSLLSSNLSSSVSSTQLPYCPNGSPICTCPPGQQTYIPNGTNGPTGILNCTPIVSSQSSSSILPSTLVTVVLALNAPVPNISLVASLGNTSLPNNVPATFTFPGSSTPISGIITNNVFIPNPGQIVPTDALRFYGANSFGTGVLTAGTQTFNIATNVVNSSYVPATNGGTITISVAIQNTTLSSSSKTNSSTIEALATTAQNNLEPKPNGVFKSKLKITDPYVCSVGSYGNVPNAKEFGVDNVYYDFYKEGSTKSSYSFKLKLNNNGDFFLPISKSSNVIAEGKYRVVFYALDNEGNKAQGEFTDYITDKCSDIQNSINPSSVRTGGSQFISALISLLTILALVFIITKSTNKSYSLNSIFGKK